MDGDEHAAFWTVGCPECGAPAEVVPEGAADGTEGFVDVVRVWCVERHWFLMSADRLAGYEPGPAAADGRAVSARGARRPAR